MFILTDFSVSEDFFQRFWGGFMELSQRYEHMHCVGFETIPTTTTMLMEHCSKFVGLVGFTDFLMYVALCTMYVSLYLISSSRKSDLHGKK